MGIIGSAVQGVYQPGKGGLILLLAAFLAPIVMGWKFLFKDSQDFIFAGMVHFRDKIELVFGLEFDVPDLSIMLPMDLSGGFGGLNGNF